MFFRNFSYLTFMCSFFSAFVKAEFQLPPYLKPCSKSSPDFNKCMIENEKALIPHIIDGNSTLNIPSMNPMEIPKISVTQGSRQIGLNMTVTDAKIYGVGSIQTNELNLDMDKKHLVSRNFIPRLEIVGNHKTSGNIMVVKISGQGKFNITAVGVDCSYENDFDYENRNGHRYAVTKSQKLKLNSIKRVYFNLENMLGDEKLDKGVNDLLNQYWKELSFDLFQDITDDLLDIMKIMVNVIVGVFPVDVMVTD